MSGDQQRADARRFLLGHVGTVSSDEAVEAFAGALSPRAHFPARRTILRRGERPRVATLLVSGMACRHADGRDGYRQLLSLQLPGDFLDLHAMPLGRLDHDVATLSDVEVVTVAHDALEALFARFPDLERRLWFSTLLDGAMHREWIFRIGRLEAIGRIAHLLCETDARLAAVGLAANGRFEFPLTQQDVGEACGLTSVHVNRTVRRLREGGLADLRDREVRILDRARLAALGEFTGEYLHLPPRAA